MFKSKQSAQRVFKHAGKEQTTTEGDVKASLVTFNKHQQESVPSSRVDCFYLNGSARELQRLRVLKSPTGPLKQQAAASLPVRAHQQVGNLCSAKWSYADDVLLKIKSLEESEGASSPKKNL